MVRDWTGDPEQVLDTISTTPPTLGYASQSALHVRVPSGMAMLAGPGSDADLDDFLDALPARGDRRQRSTAYHPRRPPFRAAEQVRERISTVRNLGYAWGYEETFGVDGINSVAVAINDGEGFTPRSLRPHRCSNAASTMEAGSRGYRFPDPERTHDIGLQLTDAAAGITEQLSD